MDAVPGDSLSLSSIVFGRSIVPPTQLTKTGVKGRTAYRKFMGECLKKAPA